MCVCGCGWCVCVAVGGVCVAVVSELDYNSMSVIIILMVSGGWSGWD